LRLTGTFRAQLFHPRSASSWHYGSTARRLLVKAEEFFTPSITMLRGPLPPWTSSTRRGVIMRGCGRYPRCSYTIVMAHRSVMAVESTSKPVGGAMAKTGASAKVSSGETRTRSAIVLRVGVRRKTSQNTSFTSRASDSARWSAVLATFQPGCHVLQTVAWPCRIELACHVERITYIMGRTCHTQACESHGQKTEVEWSIVCK
jgi:hypothetical protein